MIYLDHNATTQPAPEVIASIVASHEVEMNRATRANTNRTKSSRTGRIRPHLINSD